MTADERWQELALCAQTDPAAFYPEKGEPSAPAKRICVRCEVRVECLEDALARNDRFGVLGGLSERERRALKRKRSVRSPALVPAASPQVIAAAEHYMATRGQVKAPGQRRIAREFRVQLTALSRRIAKLRAQVGTGEAA